MSATTRALGCPRALLYVFRRMPVVKLALMPGFPLGLAAASTIQQMLIDRTSSRGQHLLVAIERRCDDARPIDVEVRR